MKNKLKLLGIFLLSVTLFWACSKDEVKPQPPKPPQPNNQPNVVAEKTIIFTKQKSDKAQVTFDKNTNKVTIKNAAGLDKSLEKGDILLSVENGGYLRKITTITKSGNEIVATTEQANFEEAFENLELAFNVPINEKSKKAQQQGLYEAIYYTAMPVVGNPVAFEVKSPRQTKAGKPMERNFKIALDKDNTVFAKGNIKLNPQLKGDFKIKHFKLESAEMGLEIEKQLALECYTKKKWTSKDKIENKKLASFNFKDIVVMAGEIPIAIRPELDIYVGFEASTEGKIGIKTQQTYNYNFGVSYNSGAWKTYKEEKHNGKLIYPTINADADAKVYIKPVLKLKFYQVEASLMKIETGIKAKTTALEEPVNGFDFNWSVDAYMNAYMGVDATIFGDIANYEATDPIFALDFNIASAENFKGNRPPHAPTLVSPENNSKTANQQVDFSWKCTDPENDALIYDLLVGTKQNNKYNWVKYTDIKTTNYQLKKALKLDTYYWKVIAREVETAKLTEPKATESAVFTFTIVKPNKKPTVPKLLTPENRAEVKKAPTLSWQASTDADGDALTYTILLSDANKSELKAIATDYTKTSYELKDLEPGVYQWQIEVADGKANVKSEVFSFTVKKITDLILSANKVKLTESETRTVTITSGSGSYTVSSKDSNIATAKLQDNTITIIGVAKGETTIEVIDTKSQQTVTIYVTVMANLTLSVNKVTLVESKTQTVTITSGSGSYTISSKDSNIATAKLQDNIIIITGIAKGETTVEVTDIESKQTAVITVIVKANVGTYPKNQKIFVQGGTFKMGSNDSGTEKPIHSVTLNDFYIGKYEVTNAQFTEFLNAKGNQVESGNNWLSMGGDCQIYNDKGTFKVKEGKENYPVAYVSWYGARAYAQWVGGRLPTEAEWEYAARGGNKSKGYEYSGSNNIDDVAWYGRNSKTKEVGTKQANELGLYDMSGNVSEWCKDKWHYNYENAPTDGTAWVDDEHSNGNRLLRGGSWLGSAIYCRVSSRSSYFPYIGSSDFGFRVVFDSIK